MNEKVYIVAAYRTPIGSYGEALASVSAIELGATAVKACVEKSNIEKEKIESIAFGNVLSANLGQAPARQISMAAGLPISVCATTINKVCASGMKAISILYNDILLGNCKIGVAGGAESMSQVPHYLPNARFGMGYGNSTIVDGLQKDGLIDVYNQTAMGVSADKTAEKYNITREKQDDFAERSFKYAAANWANGNFKHEIAKVSEPQKKGENLIFEEDQGFKKANFEKMRTLKAVFSANGTVTAANASPLSDGASAVILANETSLKEQKIQPVARIVAYAEAEQDPLFFTTTPVLATEKVLKMANLKISDIDFFEVNEAFAVVPLAFCQLLDIPIEKINLFGGAVALGHPLGNSGSRIVVTLLNVLRVKKGRYGLATICNGGGGASAMIVELL